VLRLRDNEPVVACDGAGSFASCRVASDKKELTLCPGGPVFYEPAPKPSITVCFSLLKGERSEWAAEKLTEAGVDEIIPFFSDRTIVARNDETARRERRLQAALRQAAMQSRRIHLPVLRAPVGFGELLEARKATACIAEPGGAPPRLSRPVVLVGPEGGFSSAELETADRLSVPRLGLGTNIYRGETAAMAAGVLLAGLRGALIAEAEAPV
jgi:16S rRNA (uracil1498-N3)-methyltransferase